MCNCFPWSLLPGYFSCLLTNVVIESSWFYHLMSKHHLSNGFVYYDSCFPLFQKLLLVDLYTSYMPLHRIFCYVHAGLYLNGCMDVHLASLLGHMKTIKYLYMQLFQARRNVTSILLVLAWPTNRKSTQNKEFKNAESNIKRARNTTHWHRYYCVFKTQRRI